jgi:hypothetical protein
MVPKTMMESQNHPSDYSSDASSLSRPSSGGMEVLEKILQSHPSAAHSALTAPSDVALRVPCYCEENVWRLAFRKLYQQQRQQQQQWQQHNNNNNNSNNNDHKEDINNPTILQYYVIFISNPKACVPMFQQLASSQRHQPIFWDYHVILVSTSTTTTTTTITNANDTVETSVADGAADGTTTTPILLPKQQQQVQPQQPSDSNEYIICTSNSSMVWDMDSYLPCPCPFDQYMTRVFGDGPSWPPADYIPYFRVVEAWTFLNHFSSDRSHMIQRDTGQWTAPPPNYQCIILPPPTAQQKQQQQKSLLSCGNASNNDMTLPRYMIISEQDVANGNQNVNTSSSVIMGTTAKSSSSSVFGRIYTLNGLRKRFGSEPPNKK